MKLYELNYDDEIIMVAPIRSKYMSGDSLAVWLESEDGEPFADITVNLDDGFASKNMAYVDTNNCPWAEAFIIANGLGEPMGINGRSGFCTYPLYRFNIEQIAEYK